MDPYRAAERHGDLVACDTAVDLRTTEALGSADGAFACERTRLLDKGRGNASACRGSTAGPNASPFAIEVGRLGRGNNGVRTAARASGKKRKSADRESHGTFLSHLLASHRARLPDSQMGRRIARDEWPARRPVQTQRRCSTPWPARRSEQQSSCGVPQATTFLRRSPPSPRRGTYSGRVPEAKSKRGNP